MIRPIMRDVLFLKKKAVPATKNDMSVVQDLLDRSEEHTSELQSH